MSGVWLIVLVVGVVTMAIKSAGPLLLGGRELPRPVMGAVQLLGPAVLAALVVVNTAGADRRLVLDERLIGLGIAAIALALRAPALLAVALAAAATAGARLLLG